MQATAPVSDLERRKKVRIRLRPDLDIAPHRYEGKTYYIVKDPVSLRYYRFKEQEHFLLRMMDGDHTLDDAQKQFERRFRPERLTLEDLEGFAQQLLTVGLAHNESPQAGKQLFEHRKKRLRREWMATLTNILYIKIPIIDPDRILTKMLNNGLVPGFLKTPLNVFFHFWLLLAIAGTLLTIGYVAVDKIGLVGEQTGWLKLLTPSNVGFLWVSLGILAVIRRVGRDLKFLFTSWFFTLSVMVMLGAGLLVLTHFETFRDKLPSYHEFFSFNTVKYLWIALGVVKIIHEFGHGLSCKAFGGEVHEMGALFLCLSPCLYCNVSDAWTMPNKWHRIIISFAGIYVELIIAAISTFIWWNSASHPFVNNLSLSLMVVCSVSTIVFNGNPLMRYDGYYVLSDWLEIPNLRDRSNRYLQKLCMEHCLGIEVQREQYMALGRRILFVAYAVVSYIYRWVVTFSILYFLYMFLKPYKLGAISAMIAVAAGASMVGWPLWRLAQSINKRGRLPDMKSQRVMISVGVIVALLIAFFTIPLPISRVRQTGVVQLQPDAVLKVFVPNPGGILEAMPVRNGEHVEEGQVLARLRNIDLENQRVEAEAQFATYDVQARSIGEVLSKTTDETERKRLEKEKVKAQGERDINAERMKALDTLIKSLTLRAPRTGVVVGLPLIDEIGKQWDREADKPFCSVGDSTRLRVLVPVPPADYNLITGDKKYLIELTGSDRSDLVATVRVQGRDLQTWKGKVGHIPEAPAKEVPPELVNKFGGPLTVKPSANPNVFVPQTQNYLVGIDLDQPDDGICPGTMAQVKVHCRWRTGAWWVWRTISSTFDLGLI
jgi:putative peptide zinc metalloprotease protein